MTSKLPPQVQRRGPNGRCSRNCRNLRRSMTLVSVLVGIGVKSQLAASPACDSSSARDAGSSEKRLEHAVVAVACHPGLPKPPGSRRSSRYARRVCVWPARGIAVLLRAPKSQPHAGGVELDGRSGWGEAFHHLLRPATSRGSIGPQHRAGRRSLQCRPVHGTVRTKYVQRGAAQLHWDRVGTFAKGVCKKNTTAIWFFCGSWCSFCCLVIGPQRRLWGLAYRHRIGRPGLRKGSGLKRQSIQIMLSTGATKQTLPV